jgi:hypothetical protein
MFVHSRARPRPGPRRSLADRWVIQQFAFDPQTLDPPYTECIEVSVTGDPTGSWYRYAFNGFGDPDYPKLGVWPDAYYTTPPRADRRTI